jgi:hypothetical protein
MIRDPEDKRTISLLRVLWDAWNAADAHLSGFDGGLEIAIAQSSDEWTDAEWAGLVVYVAGHKQGTVSFEVLDKIAGWRLRQQELRQWWGGLVPPPEQT